MLDERESASRVLITGATGFLGGALSLHLAAKGVRVRALARRAGESNGLERAGVKVVRGDVCDLTSVREAMRGCSHVIHLAAQRQAPGVPARVYQLVNVEGARNVADAASAERVTRVVYASTLGVHGFIARGTLDETSPIRPSTPYRWTKWLGEQVLHESRGHRPTVVVARLASVVGAGATSWIPLARSIAAGRFALIGDGSNLIDLVALEDVLDGLWRCATASNASGCYALAADATYTVRAFSGVIARTLGAPVPRPGPPAWPYRAMLHAASFTFRATGYHSPFAHEREILVANKSASPARARRELEYQPSHSVDSAVESMIADFIAEGHVRQRVVSQI